MDVKKLASSALLLSILGCGSDTTAPPLPPAQSVSSVAINSEDLAFGAIGSQATLTTTAIDSDGNAVANPTLQWAVVKGGVVTVSATGRVTSLADGTDSVRVTAGSATDFIRVTVAQIPAVLRVTNPTISMDVAGATTQVQAAVLDSNLNAVVGPTIDWSSSDSTRVVVSGTGRITAISPGTVRIDASSGTLLSTATVTVTFTGPHGGGVSGNSVPCAGGTAGAFPCDRLEIVSYMPISAIGGGAGVTLTDMWGWTDSLTSKDWALVHRVDGTAFVDVTDPSNPRYAGFLPVTTGANPNAPWRDVKVYKNHAFIVGDGSGNFGMQIFDLTQLRNVGTAPQTFSETAHYSGVVASHNIVINEATGFGYIVGANGGGQTCGAGLHMVDLRDPVSPIFAGCFSDPLTGRASTGYTHDAQCILYDGPDPDHQGKEVCFGLNETALSIADVTDKSTPIAISRAAYPGLGYVHQGWLTEDRRYLYSNDELDELQGTTTATTTMIWDVSDLDDPIFVKKYLGPNQAIDHNTYVKGNFLYQANYQFGIRVLDITDPENPTERAAFDTAPNESNTPGFGGAWTSYPFFDSGVILVTSSADGFFVLRLTN